MSDSKHVVERNLKPGVPDDGWELAKEFTGHASYAEAREWARDWAYRFNEPTRVTLVKVMDVFDPSPTAVGLDRLFRRLGPPSTATGGGS